MNSIRKLTVSGLFVALYLVLMYFNQSFAFGALQVRVATALYALNWHYSFLVIPSMLANLLSYLLFGGLGIVDIVGGGIIGLSTALVIRLLRQRQAPMRSVVFAVALIPGVGVPLYLHTLIHVPLLPLILSVVSGQLIAGLIGYFLLAAVSRHLPEE